MVNLFPPDTGSIGGGSTPAGWTCALGTNLLECTILTLAAGASAIITTTFAASSQTPAGQVLVNDAIVTSTTVDPNLTNNLATTNTTLSTGGAAANQADLAVTKTGPASVAPGQNITYTITVTNNGPLASGSAASMNEATPPDTTFVSLVSPAGWTCNTLAVGGVGRVDCTRTNAAGPLAVGATATFTLTVQAQAGTPSGSTTTNVVTVDQNVSSNVDPTLTNNRVALNTLIQVATSTPTATATATATSTPTVTPTATPTRIPGDINGDRFVDIRDYGVWRQNFGQANCGNAADLDGNCLVDIRDYGMWRQHFGEGTPPDHRGGGSLPAGIAPAAGRTPGPTSPTDGVPAVDFTAVEGLAEAGDQAPEGGWSLLRAEGASGAVPVIPEADGLILLLGGLLGFAGLAGWRARPRPPRQ